MSFTYDPNTPVGTVRLMIADTSNVSPLPLFSDEEINRALQLESSQGLYFSGQASPTAAQASTPFVPQIYSYRRAAALLLDALAANKSLLSSVIGLLDVKLSVDKAAAALRDTANNYRETEANSGAFAIAEFVNDQFQARERVWKMLLRIQAN